MKSSRKPTRKGVLWGEVDNEELIYRAHANLVWQLRRMGITGAPRADLKYSYVRGDTVVLANVRGTFARFHVNRKGRHVYLRRLTAKDLTAKRHASTSVRNRKGTNRPSRP